MYWAFGRSGGGGGFCGGGGGGGGGGRGGFSGWGWGANGADGADGWGGFGGGGGGENGGGGGGWGGRGGHGGCGHGWGGRGGHGGCGHAWSFPGLGRRLGGGRHGHMHFGGGPRRHGCSRRHRSPPPFAAFFAPDIEDWGAEYRIVTQVRGLTGDDIKLEIRGSELGVRAESGEEDSQISFKVQIPVDVAREFIMAEVNSNELTIVLPKAEPRVVTVETVDDPPQPQEQMEAEAEDVEPERRPPVVVDLNDWGSEYRLTQFAQGLTLDDINVQVRDGRLSVAIGELEVECLVPPGVVVDGIHADMDQSGILTVVLPKSEGRFIPVSVVGAAPAAPSAPPTDEGQSGMADVVRRTDVITLSDTEGDANDGGDGNDAPMAEFDENDGWVDVDGVPPKV